MKKSKRLLSILSVICLAFLVAACSSEKPESISTPDSPTIVATPSQAATQPVTRAPKKQDETQYVNNSTRSNPNDIYDATGFVSVTDVVPDAILDIRYYSTYNFVGERIDGYEQPIALLSKEAANALKKAADELREKGYRIKIFDAYRPQTAVDHFAYWAQDQSDTKMKEYFYPDVDKANLFSQGYIAYYSGHSRGCKVDLTLFDMKSGQEVDMGSPFDFFSSISHPSSTAVTQQQYDNRMILRNAMINNGFNPCSTEWWDFTYANEPYPNTYFSFPVSEDSLPKN